MPPSNPPPVLRAATALPQAHSLLLRIGLLNSLFLLSLVVARLAYHGQVHPVVYVAVGLMLAVYAAGTAQAVQLARLLSTAEAGAERVWNAKLADLDRLAARCPKVAMAGTVTGFLIAFSASTDDVAERVPRRLDRAVGNPRGDRCDAVARATARLARALSCDALTVPSPGRRSTWCRASCSSCTRSSHRRARVRRR